MAASGDGLEWEVIHQPVLYRTTFEYEPATDALTFWYSGARYESGRYRCAAAATLDPRQLPPAPAPLEEWP
jgi:hypothetical protein